MKIISPIFKSDSLIPRKYTCEGEDVSPPLRISDVPIETKSLALIVHDHDANNGDFVHWTIWNMSPQTAEIREGTPPLEAEEGMTDFGNTGWGGPCPPSGRHRYEFHLYALNKKLNLSINSSKDKLRKEIEGALIEEASLIGFYEKSKE